MNKIERSPLVVWRDYCKKHQLAYQRDGQDRPVFFPRVIGPKRAAGPLSWHISSGLGTVYSVTIMYSKGAAAGNVALIDLDEGFRMLSTVRTTGAEEPFIGMRVRVEFEAAQEADAAPVPVFVAQSEGQR